MKKILLISTYDSFLNAGISVVSTIQNAEVTILIRLSAKKQISKRQIDNIIQNKYKYTMFWLNEYKNIKLDHYDIIVISAGNSFTKSFLEFYNTERNSYSLKAITVTLFPGIIFGDIDSILARLDSDIVLCNNKNDFELASNIKLLYNLDTKVIHYGLVVLKDIEVKSPQNIYFFDQVKIPESYRDRMYIIKLLVDFALKYPDENIYIQSRTKLGERTVHINKFPYENLLNEYSKENNIPNNLLFSYKRIEECYEDIKLAITVSSTVAFETIYNKVPTIIISDLGIKKNYYNQFFLESGCMLFLKDFKFIKKSPVVSQKYYNNMIAFPLDRVRNLNILINKILLSSNKKQNTYLQQLTNFNYLKKVTLKNKILNWILKSIKQPQNSS